MSGGGMGYGNPAARGGMNFNPASRMGLPGNGMTTPGQGMAQYGSFGQAPRMDGFTKPALANPGQFSQPIMSDFYAQRAYGGDSQSTGNQNPMLAAYAQSNPMGDIVQPRMMDGGLLPPTGDPRGVFGPAPQPFNPFDGGGASGRAGQIRPGSDMRNTTGFNGYYSPPINPFAGGGASARADQIRPGTDMRNTTGFNGFSGSPNPASGGLQFTPEQQQQLQAAQNPNNPGYAGGIGMYTPTGDAFTGTRNGMNYLLGNLWNPEGLAQGGGTGPVQSFAFTNYLQHNLPAYLQGIGPNNPMYGNLSQLLSQIGGGR